MANDLSENFLNLPEPTASDEDDGLVNFSQYYFKEWSEVEALYNLAVFSDSVDEKLNVETSEEEAEVEKDSSDEEDNDVDTIGNALRNMMLTRPRKVYEYPVLSSYINLDVTIGDDNGDTADDDLKSMDEMNEESFELSSDDESSSLSN